MISNVPCKSKRAIDFCDLCSYPVVSVSRYKKELGDDDAVLKYHLTELNESLLEQNLLKIIGDELIWIKPIITMYFQSRLIALK